MESLRGKLLISGGGLYDSNFRHTVVLIGEHTADGAAGVILNRRLELTVGDAVPELVGLVAANDTLFEGGPVEPKQPVIVAELTDPGLVDVPVLGSVGFLTGAITAEIRPSILRARVFAGHAGWGPGQLEGELAGNAWIVDDATAEDIFTETPHSLWRHVLERKGPPYSRLARVPFDPSMN